MLFHNLKRSKCQLLSKQIESSASDLVRNFGILKKFEKAVFAVHLIYVYSRFDQHAAHIVVVLSRFNAVKAGFWAVGFDVGLCGQIPGRIHFQKIKFDKCKSDPEIQNQIKSFWVSRSTTDLVQFGNMDRFGFMK